MRRATASLLTGAVLAVLAGACDEDSTNPENDPSQYFKPTSPENVLRNLMRSYVNRDILAYDVTMAGEFIFVANRVEPDLGFDELDQNQDHVSTLNMFGQARSISFTMGPFVAELSDIAVYPASEGYLKIDAPEVRIEVQVPDQQGGDPLVWLVDRDAATFVFKPDSLPDRVNYTIVYQEDLYTGTLGAGHTGRVSWSRLKAAF